MKYYKTSQGEKWWLDAFTLVRFYVLYKQELSLIFLTSPLISIGISSSLFSETSMQVSSRRFPISGGKWVSWLWSSHNSVKAGSDPIWGGWKYTVAAIIKRFIVKRDWYTSGAPFVICLLIWVGKLGDLYEQNSHQFFDFIVAKIEPLQLPELGQRFRQAADQILAELQWSQIGQTERKWFWFSLFLYKRQISGRWPKICVKGNS